jgi:hypothetical protein
VTDVLPIVLVVLGLFALLWLASAFVIAAVLDYLWRDR